MKTNKGGADSLRGSFTYKNNDKETNEMNRDYLKNDYPVNLLKDLFMCKQLPDNTADGFETTLQSVLDEIPERHKTALLRRYKDQMTFREVGNALGVSPQRAVQLVCRGLSMLAHPKRRDRLLGISMEEIRGANTLIKDLNVSVRAYNCLYRRGLRTTDDIFDLSAEELKKIRGAGRRTYCEIIDILDELGYDVSKYRTEDTTTL